MGLCIKRLFRLGTTKVASTTETGGYVLDPSVAENGTAPEGTSTFYVDRDAADLLSVFLSDLLQTSSMTYFNGTSDGQLEFSDIIAHALWLADDPGGIVSNLAERMTDAMRGMSSSYVQGKAHQLEVRVSVNWPWLILLVVLVLSSCLLVIVAIMSSSKNPMIAWKSSSLATLFHGLSNPDYEVSPLLYGRQMETAAEKTKVQLRKDDNDNFHLVYLPLGPADRPKSSSGRFRKLFHTETYKPPHKRS